MGERPINTPAWRRFKRMQGAACLFAAGVYVAAALHAWRLVAVPVDVKRLFTLVFPAVYFMGALVAPLQITPVRRWLKRYTWLSFAAGFGQTPVSVVTGLGVLAAAAGLIYLQIGSASHGGRYPAGLFSAYAAGVGVLCAQALLAVRLEREPKVRQIIER